MGIFTFATTTFDELPVLLQNHPPFFPMENRELVVQSNRILQAKYSDTLSFWESFIVAKMCTMIQTNDEDFKEYKLYVKDLLEFNEVAPSGMAYKVVYEATQRLLERKISIRGVDENGKPTIVDTHIIAGVERLVEPTRGDDAYFKLIFVPKLRPYLLQLKKDFSVMQLGDYKNLHTHTAIRIYEILVSYFGRGQRVVTVEIEELKAMLGLQDKYSRFEAFKRRILDDAQRRLAESTNYSFAYKVHKKGKTPHSVEFTISRNKLQSPRAAKNVQEAETIEFETVANEAHEQLFEELLPMAKRWGMSSMALTKLIESNSEDKIRAAARVTELAEKGGRVQNLAGFFVQAVKEGYTSADDLKKKKQQEATAKVKTEQEKVETDRAHREAAKREIYEREKRTFLNLMNEQPDLIFQILATGRNGSPIRQTNISIYDTSKSFDENLLAGGVILQTSLLGIAKEIFPEKFT